MKLERLSLANYRGFEQLDLNFEQDVTVIAGVNGIGKTGILNAIATALSHALPKFTSSHESTITLSGTDIYYGKSGLTLGAALSLVEGELHISIGRRSPLTPEKVSELSTRRDELRFSYRETSKESKDAVDIEEEIRNIGLLLENPTDETTVRVLPANSETTAEEFYLDAKSALGQPFGVLYSTNRFLSRLPPILPKTKRVDLAIAYSKALTQLEVSLNDFANWYRVVTEEGLSRSGLTTKIINSLETAIEAFLPGMSDLELDSGRPPRFSLKKNDARFYLEQLSDGERGLLALIFDLTRRLAIANPDSDNPVAEGNALVMIDEIELHLHPKWQREVLNRLVSVFRNCQFVVTTHSPMVLGESKARGVRFLEYQDGKVAATIPQELYGMDANRILQELMDSPIRNKEVNEELRKLFELIDQEQFDDARVAMDELSQCMGDADPELTRASSLIKFLEGEE